MTFERTNDRSHQGVPELIRKYNPKAKIIIITCSPSSRAYSDYIHMKDLAEKLKDRSYNWIGPLSNLLVQDFKNISSFETLGSFHLSCNNYID